MPGLRSAEKPSDLTSRAYDLIQKEIGYQKITGSQGEMYYLVHHELPLIIDRIDEAPILVGVEFMYSRDPFPSLTAAARWCKSEIQDCDKLTLSKTWIDGKKPFMREVIMIAFAVGGGEYGNKACDILSEYPDIRYCATVS